MLAIRSRWLIARGAGPLTLWISPKLPCRVPGGTLDLASTKRILTHSPGQQEADQMGAIERSLMASRMPIEGTTGFDDTPHEESKETP